MNEIFWYWPARSSLVIPYLTTLWRGIVRLVVLSAVFSAVASLISGEFEGKAGPTSWSTAWRPDVDPATIDVPRPD